MGTLVVPIQHIRRWKQTWVYKVKTQAIGISPTVRTDAGILDADRRNGGGAVEHRMA